MQDTKSQAQNREKAWKLLRARLYERQKAEADAQRAESRSSMIGSGSRAEKIRTYRYKDNLVVDHRLGNSYNLSELMAGETAGYELRSKLAEEGDRKSGPAFYQLMTRLEEARFVKGRYVNKEIEGQIVRERRYKITAGGHRVARDYVTFAARQAARLAMEG